ncbi:MAG TPA: sigma-70 family RNA polymerase sigma factor [Solirubrobacteraceae bacterium]|jgi:RNA polymerase sigma factor (sigma-70 family)
MSPLSLRRYRAERLLREEFQSLRTKVLVTVRGRLRSRGLSVDPGDLEDCYAQAWQGLYKAVLEGQEIANPTGWLVLVTFRRAIEDVRSSHRERIVDAEPDEHAQEPDLESQMDDLRRLRQVFEALRKRLNTRECQAASLCYLQGLSRADAAERMGISETRMRKLMEGDGDGQSGVAGKVGQLLSIIREESWCEEQSSLMRGFAFGILDPQGERYQLALLHQRECPACRAYVASLRGLAAILPPLALPSGLGIGALGAGAALSASGGVGGASGGWLFAGGSLGAKLAGSLALLGVAGGCLALATSPGHAPGRKPTQVALLTTDPPVTSVFTTRADIRADVFSLRDLSPSRTPGKPRPRHASVAKGGSKPSKRSYAYSPSLAAEAEFGPEHPHSVAELAQPTAPVPTPHPAAPVSTHAPRSQSSSGKSGGEFGFE